jgi:hypothetical protein
MRSSSRQQPQTRARRSPSGNRALSGDDRRADDWPVCRRCLPNRSQVTTQPNPTPAVSLSLKARRAALEKITKRIAAQGAHPPRAKAPTSQQIIRRLALRQVRRSLLKEQQFARRIHAARTRTLSAPVQRPRARQRRPGHRCGSSPSRGSAHGDPGPGGEGEPPLAQTHCWAASPVERTGVTGPRTPRRGSPGGPERTVRALAASPAAPSAPAPQTLSGEGAMSGVLRVCVRCRRLLEPGCEGWYCRGCTRRSEAQQNLSWDATWGTV